MILKEVRVHIKIQFLEKNKSLKKEIDLVNDELKIILQLGKQ